MSSSVLPPPQKSERPRRPLVHLSKDPETRSVQIGLLGTILLHVLLFLLAPFIFRLPPSHPLVTPPATEEFNVELAQDDAANQPKPPPPNRFVETNPNAPDNE